MNEAIGTRNSWKTASIMLLAVLVLLVVALASMLQPPAGSSSSPGVHASPHATGGSGIAEDPYTARHVEVVAGYQQDGPR